jgi:hypothetical protein
MTSRAKPKGPTIGACDVRYTLWSRGRLLGETDLDFVFREMGFRCGWLYPTVLGDRLMPAATGVAPALRTQYIIGPDATAHADLRSAVDQEDALEVQLRGPGGEVIATESIGVIDTHYLLSIAESAVSDEHAVDTDQDAGIATILEEWSAERELVSFELTSAEETEFPRYQIQVRLVHHDSLL